MKLHTILGGSISFHASTLNSADLPAAEVQFTQLSARVSPEKLVALLNSLFTEFDELAEARPSGWCCRKQFAVHVGVSAGSCSQCM